MMMQKQMLQKQVIEMSKIENWKPNRPIVSVVFAAVVFAAVPIVRSHLPSDLVADETLLCMQRSTEDAHALSGHPRLIVTSAYARAHANGSRSALSNQLALAHAHMYSKIGKYAMRAFLNDEL